MPAPAADIRLGTATIQPIGYAGWCLDNPVACQADQHTRAASFLPLNAATWKRLSFINRLVNQAILPSTDMAHYGVEERWTLPEDGFGDCDDYAMLKLHLLTGTGEMDRAAFSFAVVGPRPGENENHLVLAVWTDAGVYILDNLATEPYPVDKMGRAVLGIQDPRQPYAWLTAKVEAAPLIAMSAPQPGQTAMASPAP